MANLKMVDEDGKRVEVFDSIVQVTACRFKKGDKINWQREFDGTDMIGDWESVTENLPKSEEKIEDKEESSIFLPIEDDDNIIFTEDFIGCGLCILGRGVNDFESGLDYEVSEGMGYEATFEDFYDILKENALKQFAEADKPKMNLGGKINLGGRGRKEPCHILRFLTVWSYDANCYDDYWSGGWECDPSWDLIGFIQ